MTEKSLFKNKKYELLLRALGLKHKLKVHDSMPSPDIHEELAKSSLARWELEDELQAIEEILKDIRSESVNDKKKKILKEGVKSKKNSEA